MIHFKHFCIKIFDKLKKTEDFKIYRFVCSLYLDTDRDRSRDEQRYERKMTYDRSRKNMVKY